MSGKDIRNCEYSIPVLKNLKGLQSSFSTIAFVYITLSNALICLTKNPTPRPTSRSMGRTPHSQLSLYEGGGTRTSLNPEIQRPLSLPASETCWCQSIARCFAGIAVAFCRSIYPLHARHCWIRFVASFTIVGQA